MIDDPLYDRTLSSFPLSVGTGLALESIFEPTLDRIDPERVIPQKIQMSQYSEFWINCHTLCKNLLSSIESGKLLSLNPNAAAQSLLLEMQVITELVGQYSPNTSTQFFICSYEQAFSKKSLHINPRKDTTDKQALFSKALNTTLKELLRLDRDNKIISLFDSEVKSNKRLKSLIMTSQIWDLLSHKNFHELHLLEPHTGVVKKRHEFYTKYLNGKDLSMIPFEKVFIYVFGDKHMFSPMPTKTKKQIIDFAIENKWTQFTTREKIRSDFSRMHDHYLRTVLISLM